MWILMFQDFNTFQKLIELKWILLVYSCITKYFWRIYIVVIICNVFLKEFKILKFIFNTSSY